MNLTDTFYVALCMTILILGVVYWFWTQNQYIQRKLNLLENIVFEIKTQIQKEGDSPPGLVSSPNMVVSGGGVEHEMGSKYPPAPSSELGDDEDLLNEELHEEMEFEEAPIGISPTLKIIDDVASAPAEPAGIPDVTDNEDLAAALQPGGVGSGIQNAPEADNSAKGSVLEGMTLKELQRLAEQKGIPTTRMRKPQLVEAIRAHSRPSPFQTTESVLELS